MSIRMLLRLLQLRDGRERARWRSPGRRLHSTKLFTFKRLDNGANYYGDTGKDIYVPPAHAHALPLACTYEREFEVDDSASMVITARTDVPLFSVLRLTLALRPPDANFFRNFIGTRARVRRYINFYFICQLQRATSCSSRHERASRNSSKIMRRVTTLRRFVTLRGCCGTDASLPLALSLFPSFSSRLCAFWIERARMHFAEEKIGLEARPGNRRRRNFSDCDFRCCGYAERCISLPITTNKDEYHFYTFANVRNLNSLQLSWVSLANFKH